jgi:hypothetical protein
MFHLLSNFSYYKSSHKVEWNLNTVSNIILIINDYGVENKHDLT